jgi:hypothetical protein
VHGQRVPDIDVRSVGRYVVIGQDVKVVNVLSVGIGFVGDFGRVVSVENVRLSVAI